MASKKKYAEAERARNEKIEYYASVNPFQAPTKGVDSGAFGKMRELEETRENSLKTKVSAASRPDNYFRLNGKAQAYEYKTNGGRVGKIVESLKRGKDGYIVYEMNLCNSTTKGKQRVVLPVIMTYSMFMELLESSGALRLNSRDSEPCIQPSNKEFFVRLSDYPLAFDKTQEYTDDDFDGLEI